MSTSGSGEVYDVVVIGGGIVGLSTAYHLTRDNTRLRVLLVEQFTIPHTRGSSNSGSRLIAKYTYPDDVYISMVTAAYDQWRDIERRSGVELLRKTGMLQIEDKSGDRTAASVAAIEKDGVAYRLFGGSQASTVHAGVCYDDSCQVLHEFSPGVLRANKCILALKNLVERQGGKILEDTQVTDVVPGDVVTVTTAGGSYRSKSVVIAAGPWVNMLLKNRGIQLPVKTMPGFQFFWKIKEGFRFSASEGAPLIKHWINKQEGYQFVFVIPEWEYPGLVKVATRFEPHNDYISPNERDQIDSSRLKQKLSEYIRKHLHFLEPTAVLLEPCMYTMTPDKHFIIDRLPGCNNIIVGAGMSGHGFQSAPEIGRVLAEMSQGHPTSHDVSMLSLKRFASKGDVPAILLDKLRARTSSSNNKFEQQQVRARTSSSNSKFRAITSFEQEQVSSKNKFRASTRRVCDCSSCETKKKIRSNVNWSTYSMQHQLSKSESMTSLWLIIVLTSPLSLAIYSDTTSFSVVPGMSIRPDVENVVILEDMGTEITCAITCFNLPTLAAYKYNSETKQCICYTQLCEDDVYDNSTDYFHYNSYHRMRPAAQCYCRQFKCLYFYSSRNGTWQESVQACSSQQLQLLLLQSDVETTWLQSVVQLQREHNHTVKTHVWQDGTDVSSTRPWQTSAGVRLQYLNFADNEPNNQGGVEDCLELNTRSMLWNDRECNVVQDIVCQMDNQQ